jgi:hypothetical protein
MIDILTIKYWNSVQVMSMKEVLSYEDAKWPDKNLPFSFPKFNREKFNFIESPTENYIVFFALKYMGFWSDDLKDDILWEKIVEDLKKNKCKILFYSPDWDSTDLVEDLGVPNAYVVSGEHNDKEDVLCVDFVGISYVDKEDKYVDFFKLFESMRPYNRDFHFLSFNHHLKEERFHLYNFLKENDILKKTKHTFFSQFTKLEIKDALGSSDGLPTKGDMNDVKLLPGNFQNEEFYLNTLAQFNSYINITTENRISNDGIFLAERIHKNFMTFQPFIVIGQPNTLSLLKKWGYKTFEPLIDEEYDKEVDFDVRFEMIKENIIRLSIYSIDELHNLYYGMKDVLYHNANHLRTQYDYELKRFEVFLEDLDDESA